MSHSFALLQGVMKYLAQVYDLSKVEFTGASAGALVAVLTACNVDPDKCVAVHQADSICAQ